MMPDSEDIPNPIIPDFYFKIKELLFMKFIFRCYFMIKEISDKISNDDINAHAASASFFIIVCFFPMIMLLLSLLKYTPVTEVMLLDAMSLTFPAQLSDIVRAVVDEIYSRSSITLISVTAVAALWTAGKSFLAISNGLDNVYMIESKSNYLLSRILSSLYTLVFMIALILVMFIMTFGNMLVTFITPYAPVIAGTIKSFFEMKYFFILVFFTLIIMLMYTFVPRRRTSLVRQLPGAVIASAGWLLFTYVYSAYTSYSYSFSNMYGSLSTIIFVMLWLYFCMYIFFIGAEINVMLEKKIINIKYLLKLRHKRNE